MQYGHKLAAWTWPCTSEQEREEMVAGVTIQPPTPPEPHPTRKVTYAEVTAGGRDGLQCASHVYVRRGYKGVPLTPLYGGPYRILHRGPKSFDVAVGTRTETVSVDRLKPHQGKQEVTEATPLTKGRPLKPRRPDAGGGLPVAAQDVLENAPTTYSKIAPA